MPQYQEVELQEPEHLLKTALEKDISNTQLGEAGSFEDLEGAKNEYAQELLDLMTDLQMLRPRLPPLLFNQQPRLFIKHAKQLQGIIDQVEKAVSQPGVHHENYPAVRDKIHDQFNELCKTTFQSFQVLRSEIRIARIEQKLEASNLIGTLEHTAADRVENISKLLGQAEDMTEGIRDAASAQSRKLASTHFDGLAQEHEEKEGNWFNAFVFSSAIAVIVIGIAFFSFDAPKSTLDLVSQLFTRGLWISGPLIAMRVTLSKYNLERNLRIIYSHRSAVLRQFAIFEQSLKDDEEAKNQLRLEIAKVLFNDPETGYTKHSPTTELNISPIVGSIEKVSKVNPMG